MKQLINKLKYLLFHHSTAVLAVLVLVGLAIFLGTARIETVSQHQNRLAAEAQARQELLDQALAAESSQSDDLNQSTDDQNESALLADGQNGETTADGVTDGSAEGDSDSNDVTADGDTLVADGQDQDGSGSQVSGATGQNQNSQSATGSSGTSSGTSAGTSSGSTSGSGSSDSSTAAGSGSQSGSNGGTEQAQPGSSNSDAIVVTVRITCDKVLGNSDLNTTASIPSSGVMLDVQVALSSGANVYEAFQAACQDNGISYVNNGTSRSAYISSIAGLSEKECGRYSGWKYRVNGTVGAVVSNQYILNNGDVVEWYFATTYTD